MLARLWIVSLTLLVWPLGCFPAGALPVSSSPGNANRDDEPPLLADPTPVQLATFNAPSPEDSHLENDEDLKLDPVEAMIAFDDVSEMDEGNDSSAQLDAADPDANGNSPEDAKALQDSGEQRQRDMQTLISALFIDKPDYTFDFQLTDTRGQPLAKRDFHGKLLIVNIWGTWCGPCRRELPDLIATAKKYKSRGVEMIGINTEQEFGEAAAASIRDLQKSFGISYRCALGDEAVFRQIPDFSSVPTTLFFDRQGALQVQWDGTADQMLLDRIIERLLADSPPEPKADGAAKSR